MSVVQRCPNCGTTGAAPGECEACHEAQVRYYCTNHEPGLWLDGRTCPTCDARRADAARRPAKPPSATRVRSPAAPARAPRAASPTPLPYEPTPLSHEPPDRPEPEPRRDGGLERARLADDVGIDEMRPAPATSWGRILGAAMLAGSMRRRPTPDVAPSGGGVGGMLKSLLRATFIVIALIAAALYMLVRSLF